MPITETFEPHKKTLGELLASTSPPLKVPDFQRDYSWGKDQVAEFWEDLVAFAGDDSSRRPSREYFLGAVVLVNSGAFHLVLDGQQRLATATILLAAIRDKMVDYKASAAQQVQDNFIFYTDEVTGESIVRLELNVFDRVFFKECIQKFPRNALIVAAPKSHQLIVWAYEFFADKLRLGWEGAGGGKAAFTWLGHISVVLRSHVALITVISNDEQSAASIFTTLNDRGIGLSSVDLVRSQVLQRAHETQRKEILDCWEGAFAACGRDIGAETLMRISWVAEHGDLKSRALYKVIKDELDGKDEATAALDYSRNLKTDALLYRELRDGDSDDPELEKHWLALRVLKFNGGYPLLIAAAKRLDIQGQKTLVHALCSLVVRHNIVCNLDRASLESEAFSCCIQLSGGQPLSAVIGALRTKSPDETLFAASFKTLQFSNQEHSVARYMLEMLDGEIGTTSEIDVAGSSRVHVEHIYPQTPKAEDRWAAHDTYVRRLGNLTLLDRKLNVQIKNSLFGAKKPSYQESRLRITHDLLKYDEWTPKRVEARQAELLIIAERLWPLHLTEF